MSFEAAFAVFFVFAISIIKAHLYTCTQGNPFYYVPIFVGMTSLGAADDYHTAEISRNVGVILFSE
jgi:hypothetical protein